MAYRLGLDIGANSIGWCALALDDANTPSGLIGMGVRIYPDGRNPKDGTSLAAARRLPRAMRRNRDRYLRRRSALLNALTRYGMMPDDTDERCRVAALDPYTLRAEALRRKLEPFELGRTIFHLNQRRGFKSSRKVDRNANESGPILEAATNTQAELKREGHVTLGSWLSERHARHAGVRVRLAGSGKTAAYPFYPTREMIEEEFEVIWDAQAGWNAALTDETKRALKAIIFFQRPLKSPPVGKCWMEPGEDRASRALPTVQQFRIAQTLAHLRLRQPREPERPFSEKERTLLATLLARGSDQTFDQVRKKLGLPSETDFNSRDDKLVGCATAARLGAKKCVGPAWHQLSRCAQDSAVQAILNADTDEAAIATMIALGLPEDAAIHANDATLPDGHVALSAVAIRRILPHLQSGMNYSDAVQAAGYPHHSDRRTGEIRSRLPYYGEILRDRIGTGTGKPEDDEESRLGRAPNPTVHVALNELRRVVNAIIDRHALPSEIVVETLRDLGRSKKQREEWGRDQHKNRDNNDRRRRLLAEMSMPVNTRNLIRLRLWEEQASDPKNRVCPYTGTPITPATALSDAIEEDHILPFALSLDDSAANRILVTREANRMKSRQTPFEAFGHTAGWTAILERVSLLPSNKRWRFEADALGKLAREGDFLARHLTDSATITRWATEYLQIIAPDKVRSVPGRLTSLLRHALGLNSLSVLGKGGRGKDRTDHRHHAIDAVVVALTDRSLLQRITKAAQNETTGRLLADLLPPWEGFAADISARAQSLVVSHKPDTGWQAAMHNDTAYGAIRDAGSNMPNVVVRRPLDTFVTWSPEDVKASVRDLMLGSSIAEAVSGSDATAKKTALANVAGSAGHIVRRVRTIERLQGIQAIADRRTGKPYKLVKRDGNHRAEIWRMPGGALRMEVISTFAAAHEAEAARLGRDAPDRRPHPAAKLLMRLHKNDIVAVGQGAARRLLRLVQMRSGQITCAGHSEAGNLKTRNADRNDPFKYVHLGLSRMARDLCRKVHVTADGRVFDAGTHR